MTIETPIKRITFDRETSGSISYMKLDNCLVNDTSHFFEVALT